MQRGLSPQQAWTAISSMLSVSLPLPASWETRDPIRSCHAGVVRQISRPATTPEELAEFGQLRDRLRNRHQHLCATLRPSPGKAQLVMELRTLDEDCRRINARLKIQIDKLEALDPALAASLRRVAR